MNDTGARQACAHLHAVYKKLRLLVFVNDRDMCPVVDWGVENEERRQIIRCMFDHGEAVGSDRNARAGVRISAEAVGSMRGRDRVLPEKQSIDTTVRLRGIG